MKGTIGSLAAGTTPTIAQIPCDDVIFWFQVIAFSMTIIVGVMTAYATWQKIKKWHLEEHGWSQCQEWSKATLVSLLTLMEIRLTLLTR